MADENTDQIVESEAAPETEVEIEASPEAASEEGQYDDDGNLIEEAPAEVDDDSEEVEHEGQKFKIPKALKPALLFQADYTKKTQALAEQRAALDTERTSVVERLAAANQIADDVIEAKAQVRVIETQLKGYTDIDWPAWTAGIRALRANGQNDDANNEQLNYTEARETMGELQRAKAAAEEQATQKTTALQTELTEAEQTERQRHLQSNWEVLQRDIPEWSQDKLLKVMKHGADNYGFSPQELSSITDARVIKAFHRLHEVDKEAAKTAAVVKTEKITAQVQQQQAVQPAVVVGGRQAPTRPSTATPAGDRLSTDEWMKQEAARVRRKATG